MLRDERRKMWRHPRHRSVTGDDDGLASLAHCLLGRPTRRPTVTDNDHRLARGHVRNELLLREAKPVFWKRCLDILCATAAVPSSVTRRLAALRALTQ